MQDTWLNFFNYSLMNGKKECLKVVFFLNSMLLFFASSVIFLN
jgi:hypothetical protein